MIQVSREALHRLIDELAEEDVPVVARMLAGLRAVPPEVQPCPECGALEHEPNDETIRALQDSRAGIGVERFDNLDEMWDALGL